jgi:hypothetical protein
LYVLRTTQKLPQQLVASSPLAECADAEIRAIACALARMLAREHHRQEMEARAAARGTVRIGSIEAG